MDLLGNRLRNTHLTVSLNSRRDDAAQNACAEEENPKLTPSWLHPYPSGVQRHRNETVLNLIRSLAD